MLPMLSRPLLPSLPMTTNAFPRMTSLLPLVLAMVICTPACAADAPPNDNNAVATTANANTDAADPAQPFIEGNPINAAPDEADADTTERVDAAPSAMASSGFTGVLPQVRLTPRDIDVPSVDRFRLDLGGTWGFVFDVPASFNGAGDSVNQWDQVTMPGHPTLQGFPPMHKEDGVPVAYRKTFDLPADWAGHRVVLRFEGVDGLTKLWVNGSYAGSNDIATLPSEFDITDHANAGETNEITLTIEKSLVTHWSKRKLGGITREVYVQALPRLNLARLHVDTDLHPETDNATLNAHLRVANQGDEPVSGVSVRFTLVDADGKNVAFDLAEQDIPLPPVSPGQTMSIKLPLKVDAPALWTAETPNLYRIRGDLKLGEDTVMSARQAFGFREIEVVGHELRLNGQPVRLFGTNYHITYPGLGETMSRELIRRDLELFKGCNFDTMRSRPTPDIHFVELCDEMGVYTTVEAMITLMMYDRGPKKDHGADPAIAPGYRHHVATMIESYYSNPSVLTWGLGNECPYYDWFQTAALGMHAADPSRPLFFGSDARLGVGIPFMDINDDHYPRAKHGTTDLYYGVGQDDDPTAFEGTGWDYPDDRPNIFTEWMHVHVNNVKEINYDPGIDDYWGHVADTHIEQMFLRPHFTGGFHFKGAPYRGIGVNFPWRGVFTEDRRPLDLYWHVKKTHSPVRIFDTDGTVDAAANELVLEVLNRFDFVDLDTLDFAWKAGDRSGVAEVNAAPGGAGELRLPLPDYAGQSIELSVRHDDGREIDRFRFNPGRAAPSHELPAPSALAWQHRDETLTVRNDHVEATFDTATGQLSSLKHPRGNVVVDGPPTVLVLPAQLRNFQQQKERTLVNQAFNWQPTKIDVDESRDRVIVAALGQYDRLEGGYTTTIYADGRVTVAYDFNWTELLEQKRRNSDEMVPAPLNVFSAGLAIPVGAAYDTLRWDRDSLWTVYPELHVGRPNGEAPAEGDAHWASVRQQVAEGDYPPGDFPWSQKLVSGVTRDFRSTKFNIHHAQLVDANGYGIELLGDGDTVHAQAVPANDDLDGELKTADVHGPRGDGFHFHALNFHNGGTEPHLTKSLRFETILANEGTAFSGGFTFRVVGGE